MSESQPRPDKLRRFAGAVAVVTGGAGGIGAALGRALARRGATVILVDRQGGAAKAEAQRVCQQGGRAEAQELDVRDHAAVARTIDRVFAEHGRLDFLFNNAGVGSGGEVRHIPLDDWRYILEVNVMGVINGIHAAYPRMVEQGFGHIVNTASMGGLLATPYTTPYGASKHALVGVSRSLRIEAAPHNVHVSVLCPGVIRTPILINAGRFGRFSYRVPEAIQRQLWESMRPLDPDQFAFHALDGVRRNQAIIIVPSWWRLVSFLNGISPSLIDFFAGRQLRQIKDVYEQHTQQDSGGRRP